MTYISILLENLKWLSFESDTVVLDKQLFTRSLVNNRAFEAISHYLFSCLDTHRTNKDFRGCWPARDASSSLKYRQVAYKWLNDLRFKSEFLLQVSVRKSTLQNCQGLDMERLMMAFSSAVLELALKTKENTNVVAIHTLDPKAVQKRVNEIADTFSELEKEYAKTHRIKPSSLREKTPSQGSSSKSSSGLFQRNNNTSQTDKKPHLVRRLSQKLAQKSSFVRRLSAKLTTQTTQDENTPSSSKGKQPMTSIVNNTSCENTNQMAYQPVCPPFTNKFTLCTSTNQTSNTDTKSHVNTHYQHTTSTNQRAASQKATYEKSKSTQDNKPYSSVYNTQAKSKSPITYEESKSPITYEESKSPMTQAKGKPSVNSTEAYKPYSPVYNTQAKSKSPIYSTEAYKPYSPVYNTQAKSKSPIYSTEAYKPYSPAYNTYQKSKSPVYNTYSKSKSPISYQNIKSPVQDNKSYSPIIYYAQDQPKSPVVYSAQAQTLSQRAESYQEQPIISPYHTSISQHSSSYTRHQSTSITDYSIPKSPFSYGPPLPAQVSREASQSPCFIPSSSSRVARYSPYSTVRPNQDKPSRASLSPSSSSSLSDKATPPPPSSLNGIKSSLLLTQKFTPAAVRQRVRDILSSPVIETQLSILPPITHEENMPVSLPRLSCLITPPPPKRQLEDDDDDELPNQRRRILSPLETETGTPYTNRSASSVFNDLESVASIRNERPPWQPIQHETRLFDIDYYTPFR
ncbi:HAUS augmin-like complex subunit 6 N-terminus-domain-containing protein [Gilbertella persicaria]|uniref:HAUS augmin-like complex subunit 6 N-terminus-domain-containing protein n=1 Tax=Gilbertella persicaria TaxID=101096 RepID=UPI00221F122F|nr:HAUS augmin-like complex subunit 6 N-terminus-domain-containing protein [Gilbertella persicaria]KAI8090149.1 HAUS augmin-like complex subunit 6 N-terminus-domain-containing protein [Gilbertella persicaria]